MEEDDDDDDEPNLWLEKWAAHHNAYSHASLLGTAFMAKYIYNVNKETN